MTPIVKVENLVKRYKKASSNAVDDISFTVDPGEFFALLGPNGAGKTTTISILTTTLAKTSGKLSIAGYDIDQNPSEVRKNVGIIFQNPSLDLNLTAEENIRFHAILYGLYPFQPTFSFMPESYKKKVWELADLLGLQKEIFQAIKTFSGGMRRKLEIIRSLMHNPKVLFLDEPTSGLDPLSRQTLWEYLRQIRKTKKTTIFLTTHYLEESEEADRVCIINRGKILFLGTPSDIKKKLTREYVAVDAADRESLRRELVRQRLAFEDGPPYLVNLQGTNLQTVMKKIETPLTLINVHTPTVEEAYLEIIGHADSETNI